MLGIPRVVAIKKRYVLSRREVETSIASAEAPFVLLASIYQRLRHSLSQGIYEILTVVGTAIINCDEFPIGKRLIANTLYSSF